MSALREDQVEMAMRFLGNEKVAPRPVSEKEGFLERKGLTKKEIAEAFKRFEKSASSGDAPSAAADSAFADAAASAAVAPAPAAPAPAPPQMPAPGPAYPVPQYSAPDPGAWASPAGPYGPPPPWANFQGYGPPPEPPPSSGGPWWVWLLGGLGAGLAGTLLANPLRRSDEGYSAGNGQQAGGGAQQYAPLQLPAAQPLQAAATSSKAAEIGGEIEGKASYEELLALLRQQSEEARENAAMCSKALQTTQEQHQKMFAEMQKALQTANQQRTAKPQPTELSAATVQALASLIRDAPPASSAPPPPSSGFDVLPPLGVDALGGAVPMAGPGAMALGPVPGHFGAVASADGMPMGGGVPGLGGTSLRESFDAINLSLQRLVAESSTKVEATKSLNTVSMILGNILKDPTSDKHPKVNTTSARFSELFRNNGAASDLLKLAGFQYQEPNFTFGNGTSPPSVDACQRTLDLLQEFQRNIDQAWAARAIICGSSFAEGGFYTGAEMGLAMKLEPSCGQRMPRRPPYTRLVLATAAATWLCGHVALQLQPVFVAMAPANRLAPATGTLARARTAMFGHMMAARTTYEDLDPEVRELAERVNELLETGGARMWRTYCKTELKSQVFDPRRQSVENLRSFLDFYRPDLQELKRLFKIQPPSVYLFKQFIFDQDMSVNSQLTDVPPPWVRKFLNMYNEGDVYEVTVASAALQAEVKELTKDSTSYMAWHWKKFCFQRSFGVSMPDAVPAEIIKNFLKEYHAGSFGELAMTDDELTSQVNEVLRAGGGDAWRTFVDEQEVESMRNPKRFPAYIVRDFLSQIEFEDEDDNSGFTP